MSLSERLDRMRSDIPGCSLASFGDLRTGMALRSSASRPFKQDFLEEILKHAACHFEASDLVCEDVECDDGSRDRLIVATPRDLRIFVRSPDNPIDVVCCLCAGLECVPQVVDHAHGIFESVAVAG
ncbi:hypothetical protein JQU17_01030 [Ponticoccus sp. SC2-23]|uniref:hypothetical protein n=1 Tax=Alexandriicola marinus TaxID=2081710 RepID=UPI000FD9030B|nr:hypothetical protein [Alexandriicola marinus]MBM1218764.1 hypothetical protein [Ponticoccus sp. SC6-9]MBM1224164.1 hypothetical protein [Ponticoccus sp. SC6-15]MBM1230057.1 hypothetical protein [Ponticoccus sp. SC6-38]MBM1233130.1 hypothetical protein [Ponticoccus sp. SC6-45]MBM1236920.1 hypothetical protein [Ponticoccus sp. SC6-49]MBM1242141.1 hypothetical protein [Ponticoccus sp. SC2-64]MBM1246654.1 hypothetical protein [Ponticoccus sp. SC6-42]MBM1251132.1 hypothetical protein [Pontico